MKINLLVTGDAYASQSAYSATQFALAALQLGHEIDNVFFYQAGVSQGARLALLLADEFEPLSQWLSIKEQSNCSLMVCVSAAERRGVLGEQQAQENNLVANLHSDFEVVGLGVLHDMMLSDDKLVSFK